jgi:hypothetical protein
LLLAVPRAAVLSFDLVQDQYKRVLPSSVLRFTIVIAIVGEKVIRGKLLLALVERMTP